jgi:cysteine desulfurase/selenocysteine lyase
MISVRDQFPALKQTVRGGPLTYLDSAATTLKPISVIESVKGFLEKGAANVHRGAHFLSDQATEKFEHTRELLKDFLGAESVEEIVFTYGTTDGLNLLAHCLGHDFLQPGDQIVLSEMEHHANLVPWHLLSKRKGIELVFLRVTDGGELDFSDFEKKMSSKVKIVSLVHCSNTLGTLNDLAKFFNLAKSHGALTIADAAQSVSCGKIDVKELGCDFLVFSGHKLFGPYGIGVLYGRKNLLNGLPPYRGGGAMIDRVYLSESTYLSSPYRFEAGTPNIEGVIGLGAAIEFVNKLKWADVVSHEKKILNKAEAEISDIPGIRIMGAPSERRNILSFTMNWAHPSDVGQLLDQQGIAVRAGHHCTQPLMYRYGVTGTLRASFSIYSNEDDVVALVNGLKKAKELLT